MGLSLQQIQVQKGKPISNVGNLWGKSCYRSYSLWKMELSDLISNSWLVREWVPYWCMLLLLSLVFFFLTLNFLVFLLFFLFPLLFLFSRCQSVVLPSHYAHLWPFYTVFHDRIYHFYPFNYFWPIVGVFPRHLLVCWLPNHHHYTVLAMPLLILRKKWFCFVFNFLWHSHPNKGWAFPLPTSIACT